MLLCAALALSAHAQTRGVGGHGFPGGHRGGQIIGNRGFVSRPVHHQNFARPFVPFGVAVPMWWDEPDVIETEAPPAPPPVVVVVKRDETREETPARTAEPPLIIERDGDRYVQRAANYEAPVSVTPASRRPRETPNAPVIILRDGERIALTDYAVTTGALYDLSGGRVRKIQLFDVDLPATTKANHERGVKFTLPGSMEIE